MLRSAILGAAFMAIAAPAFASGFTFETAKPVSDTRFAVIGTVWLCNDTVCTGDLERKKASVRDCKKLAKKVGEIVSFKNTNSELTAEEIEECKTAARKR